MDTEKTYGPVKSMRKGADWLKKEKKQDHPVSRGRDYGGGPVRRGIPPSGYGGAGLVGIHISRFLFCPSPADGRGK